VIEITVVYCFPDRAHVIPLRVSESCTIAEAIRQSGILDRCPEINLDVNRVGIFNRLCDPGTPLRDGDRVEIYRPLVADPKTARRRRAARTGGNNP
jgi:hypothetical protein